MIEVQYERGVHLPQIGFWLDPHRPRDFAFISHAHSDHTGRHGRTLCTPATEKLMRLRMGGDLGEVQAVPYGEKIQFPGWTGTMLPAGHVLGSAQLLIESDAGSLLYTGDFKLRKGLSSEHATSCHADTLIMETTYGKPHYHFPPTEEVQAAVVKFCVEALEDGETPVLLGYALGKAQEILAVLREANLPIMLHGTIAKLMPVYEECGIAFPPHEKFEAAKAAGHVVVCPPNVVGSRTLTSIKHRRVAMMTGWALDGGARYRLQVDTAFPLSDHADYQDLLRHVEAVQPERVLTLHGFAQEFARDLRARGIEAWALTGANQLELAIPTAAAAQVRRQEQEMVAEGFNQFCLTGEAVNATTGKLEKIRILAAYLKSMPPVDFARAAVWLTGRPFPLSDDQPLNVGSAVIRRALLSASGLSEGELRVISRRNNDSGLTAAEAMAANPGNETLSFAEVQEFFEAIRATRGPLQKGELLKAMLLRLPARAAGFLVRILTGDLRIGLKEGLLEEAVAKAFEAEPAAVREGNMLLGDIGRIAVLASEGRLAEAELTPFRPVKCMLASPEPDAEAVWDRLGATGEVWLEDKLDGIRAQMHCAPGRCEIYSRELKRITATFPEIQRAAMELGHEAVFDGEILAWDNGRALSFFELQKRLGRRDEDLFLGAQIPVVYAIFDVLRLDGVSLMRAPLSERRARLEALHFSPSILMAEVLRVHDAEAIETAFRAARDRGNEGLMAKDPASLYLPGRRGLAWIKLKKEFATLDVVVVAVEYGHGRRNKVLSDYTFAVRDEKTGALLPIGKAYSGLTDAEIAEMTPKFLEMCTNRKGNRLEVTPEVVIEVAFDSIQPSERHASGLALRFPRIKNLRPDKTVADIDTLTAARKLVRT